jgi:hypothetical protein
MANRKRRSDPDRHARWQEGHDEMKRLLERRLERHREFEEQEARHRARLRRLTFGLLGR